MPALVVDSLHCVQDTPEWSADEVYLLVVRASARKPWDLQVFPIAPKKVWEGLLEGQPSRETDVVVDRAYGADQLYLAALLEQDGERDFGPGVFSCGLEQALDEVYRNWSSIRKLPSSDLAQELLTEFQRRLKGMCENDEPIGLPALLEIPKGAQAMQLSFECPRGHYRLQFKLVDRT